MPPTLPRRAFPAKLRLVLYVLLILAASAASAQLSVPPDAPPPPPAPGQYVLHAYTDLLQIPTLVLDSYGAPLGRLDTHSFQLQIDSGPAFHPSALHTESDEPLSLAVVLDASGAQSDLISGLAFTPGRGLPVTLLPDDTLSVYAFDCRIFRSAEDLPPSNPAFTSSVERVLASHGLHNSGGKTCPNSKHLWEAIEIAVSDLAKQPGRRAILVLSDGQDNGSAIKWELLREISTRFSIAIFGLRDTTNIGGISNSNLLPINPNRPPEDLFAELIGRTGGIVLSSEKKTLGAQLEHVIALLRSRYILQFSRPEMPGGEHHLDVHVTDKGATAYSAGISVPARDSALWNDPTTVPTDTSKLPVVGKRKPLKP